MSMRPIHIKNMPNQQDFTSWYPIQWAWDLYVNYGIEFVRWDEYSKVKIIGCDVKKKKSGRVFFAIISLLRVTASAKEELFSPLHACMDRRFFGRLSLYREKEREIA